MRQDSDRLNTFLEAYERYSREILQPTQREIRDALAPWQRPDSWSKYQRTNRIPIPTPVRSIFSRIKRPEQVVDKVFRKPDLFPEGLSPESFRTMHDTIGVRVQVYFLSHLPLIDRELRSSERLEISAEEMPTAYMTSDQTKILSLDHLNQVEKESGYCSVHYLVRLKQSCLPPRERPWFELQVRTVAQDLWSTMEHNLGYKPGRRTNSSARKQFKILSKLVQAIDEHFNFLYEELNRFQEEASYEDADLLDVENLPPVLAEVGISCAQRDINNILKFLYARGVNTILDMRRLAGPKRLDIIRNTYLSATGRLPANLEVIATLAVLRGVSGESEEIRRIKSQIAYRGAWDSIRQEFSDG